MAWLISWIKNILPTGHIYPPEYRQVWDLLRRRRQLVKHASSHVISIQNQIWRSLGYRMSCADIRKKSFELPFEKNSFLYHSAHSNLIMLETGDINRFSAAGNYASYCRCVSSVRESNGKKKGSDNRKAGNKYLSWAFCEAAHYLVRFDAKAKRFYERKKTKTQWHCGHSCSCAQNRQSGVSYVKE
jgi:transposase